VRFASAALRLKMLVDKNRSRESIKTTMRGLTATALSTAPG
jgi:hypothetical protein